MTPLHWVALVQIILGAIFMGAGVQDQDGPKVAGGLVLIALAVAFVVAA